MPGGEVGASSGGSGDTRQGRSRLMARRCVLGLVASLAMLAACNGVTHEQFEPIHYRLTATVETPEGLRSGSSVIEVTTGMSRMSGAFAGSGHSVRGEAVAVDLPGGQTLFVLLRSARDIDWAANMIGVVPLPEQPAVPSGDRDALIAQKKQMLDLIRADRQVRPIWDSATADSSADLSQRLPYFVRFRDIADPRTVEQVDPDDLAKSFGPGVKLKSLTVQMTDDSFTVGIRRRFSWWSEYKSNHFDGTGTISEPYNDKNLESILSSGSFSTEFNK